MAVVRAMRDQNANSCAVASSPLSLQVPHQLPQHARLELTRLHHGQAEEIPAHGRRELAARDVIGLDDLTAETRDRERDSFQLPSGCTLAVLAVATDDELVIRASVRRCACRRTRRAPTAA